MPSAANLAPDGRFLGLFVGPTKSGKTVAECSFPGRKKVLDFDGRIRGILGAPWINKDDVEYKYYPPRVAAGQKLSYQEINDDFETMLVDASQGRALPDTLILDSLTSEAHCLISNAVGLTHVGNKGKKIGTIGMPDPNDYNFESINIFNTLAFLRSLPIQNIIVSAHIIDKWGKTDPDDPYSEKGIVGERLSLRDKIAAGVGIYFDHCFRFDRKMVGNEERFYVQFRGDLASTSYEKLPPGQIDITGKNFYEGLMRLAKGGEGK